MALTNKLVVAALAASLLSGCTTFKQATGQIDKSTLPGAREDILPPDQTQARDPAITGQPLPPDPMVKTPSAPGAALPPSAPMPKVAAPGAPAVSAGKEAITDAKPGADCDPKVDLCPQPLSPDPLPPPSPLKVEKPAKGSKVAMKDGKAMAKKTTAKKPIKQVVKKKAAAEKAPTEPKADTPPPPGPVVADPPKPQGQ